MLLGKGKAVLVRGKVVLGTDKVVLVRAKGGLCLGGCKGIRRGRCKAQ